MFPVYLKSRRLDLQNKRTHSNNMTNATAFLPLPQNGAIMRGSDIMHATDFFLLSLLLFNSMLLTSFKVSSAVIYAPTSPSPPSLDMGMRRQSALFNQSPAGFNGCEQTQQGSSYSIVSHTGGSETTAYTYL